MIKYLLKCLKECIQVAKWFQLIIPWKKIYWYAFKDLFIFKTDCSNVVSIQFLSDVFTTYSQKNLNWEWWFANDWFFSPSACANRRRFIISITNAALVQEWFIPSQNLLLHIKPSLEILTCKFLVAMDIQKCLSSLEGGTVLAIVCIWDEMHVHLTVFIFFSLNWPQS